MHPVFENGNQQNYKHPWCLYTSFCGDLYSYHHCQMTSIPSMSLGTVTFMLLSLLALAAVEDILACWIILKSAVLPLVHAVTRQLSTVSLEHCPPGVKRSGGELPSCLFHLSLILDSRGLALFSIHQIEARKANQYSFLRNFILQP